MATEDKSRHCVASVAVEGDLDEAVARRILEHSGIQCGTVYGKQGKDRLRRRIAGYNQAARLAPWFIVVDLDRTACAPELISDWLPDPERKMVFRIAVPQIEAWLLADVERIAAFLSVQVGLVPVQPEEVANAKEAMVNLARRSRRRDIREDMVPREGSGRSVGPGYTSRLIEFVSGRGGDCWRPGVAAHRAGSLYSAVLALAKL